MNYKMAQIYIEMLTRVTQFFLNTILIIVTTKYLSDKGSCHRYPSIHKDGEQYIYVLSSLCMVACWRGVKAMFVER